MAYVVNKTDGTILARLSDGLVNTTASDLTLIGRNFAGWGEYYNENLVKLLENFSSTQEPLKPLSGQLWFDKASKTIKVYSGTTFKPLANISVNEIEPTDLATGDLWFDSANEQLYVYNGTNFKLIGPSLGSGTAASGFQVATLEDTLGLYHTVVKMLVDGTTVAIISKDQFDPGTSIPGFPAGVFKGYTLNESLLNNQFYGTARTAEAISYLGERLTADKFLRSDINTSTDGNLIVYGNLAVGTDVFGIIQDGTDVTIRNIQDNGKINITVNIGGDLTNAICLDGSTGYIGIWNDAPASELDVTGDLTVSGNVTAVSMTASGTITAGDNSSRVATTEFVQGEKVSPAFTGTPTAPTAELGTNTTQIATTAFVNSTVNSYLPTAGGTMTGALYVQRADALTPAIAFGVDQDTGIFSEGANTINIATGGVKRFTFDNSGSLTVTGTVIELSDSSVKEDIRPIENALDIVLNLTGVRYRSKITGQQQIGLLADKVQKVEPSLVSRVDANLLGVNYTHTTALLIEALKQQNAQIEELKRRLDAAIQIDK